MIIAVEGALPIPSSHALIAEDALPLVFPQGVIPVHPVLPAKRKRRRGGGIGFLFPGVPTDPQPDVVRAAIRASVGTGLAMSEDDLYERLAAAVGEELELLEWKRRK